MQTRTDALSLVVDRPPVVARRTLLSAVGRATHAKARHAVLACANIRYKVATIRLHYVRMFSLLLVRGKSGHVHMHSVLAWLRVNPVWHDAHLTAPYAGQSAPVAPTPFLHMHLVPTRSGSKHMRNLVRDSLDHYLYSSVELPW